MANRKPTTYNLILKQFTKLNNKLPEENKLSIKLRREIIKKVLLPQFKGVPQYKIKLKSLKGLIINEIEKVNTLNSALVKRNFTFCVPNKTLNQSIEVVDRRG